MATADLVVSSTVTIPGSELVWKAVRSSGPGGQNVNRVSTKVELVFDVQASTALTAPVKARLARLAAGRTDAEGRLVLVSQATRSQAQNLEDARQKLAALIRAASVVPKRRRATRPTRASRERRLEAKRRTSEKKRDRRSWK
jgi:ribosome-associated protein